MNIFLSPRIKDLKILTQTEINLVDPVEYVRNVCEVGQVIAAFGNLILNLAESERTVPLTNGVNRDDFVISIFKDGIVKKMYLDG